ncbi:hypothetical protein BDZ45DRAFT_373402 [Acephala macrosclerotiorum]|nr:hypothetical protein BDZ45DRAFT_373402 [Acephala macrosclerotiorum]
MPQGVPLRPLMRKSCCSRTRDSAAKKCSRRHHYLMFQTMLLTSFAVAFRFRVAAAICCCNFRAYRPMYLSCSSSDCQILTLQRI